MQNWNHGMVLNREKPVWHGDKNTPRDTSEFGDKTLLVFQTANMLKHGIGGGDIK